MSTSLKGVDQARKALADGRPALVWRQVVADTETPVGAALKLFCEGRGDFLLESVEGGDVRGRYSLMGLDPDLDGGRRPRRERVEGGQRSPQVRSEFRGLGGRLHRFRGPLG